uniref:Src homology 2 domain containing transforming protein D n=1 Tax=Ursus americanus TaxID=9643 RepID=A0A452RYA5_URSAM
MAKWLRDYLSFGGRRPPPQPPTPDYTESDILRAYREQKNLDFEDPYEDSDSRLEPDPAGPGDSKGLGDTKYDSPKHRLIKVEAADMARAKVLLGSPGEETIWVKPCLLLISCVTLSNSLTISVPWFPDL